MKAFKRILAISLAFTLSTMSINSMAQQGLPNASPFATIDQRVGVTDIQMEYCRPGVKGRTIWGGIIAYDQMWRAGANSSTKITFSTDVMINNVELKAGTYSLSVIPSKNEWTFVINSYTEGWGLSDYDQKKDAVRVKSSLKTIDLTESLIYTLSDLTSESAHLNLAWGKISAGFEIQIDTKKYGEILASGMIKDAKESFGKSNDLARWYLYSGNSDMALKMSMQSTSLSKTFWNMSVLSEAYAAKGDMKMAVKMANESLALSEKSKVQSYIDMNKANIKKWSKM